VNGGSPSARPQDAIATILASMNTMNTETHQSATTMRVAAPLDYSTSVAQGQHDEEEEKVEQQQQQFDTSLHRTEILPLNLATSQHPTVIQVQGWRSTTIMDIKFISVLNMISDSFVLLGHRLF
jgi:hypothetical protein